VTQPPQPAGTPGRPLCFLSAEHERILYVCARDPARGAVTQITRESYPESKKYQPPPRQSVYAGIIRRVRRFDQWARGDQGGPPSDYNSRCRVRDEAFLWGAFHSASRDNDSNGTALQYPVSPFGTINSTPTSFRAGLQNEGLRANITNIYVSFLHGS